MRAAVGTTRTKSEFPVAVVLGRRTPRGNTWQVGRWAMIGTNSNTPECTIAFATLGWKRLGTFFQVDCDKKIICIFVVAARVNDFAACFFIAKK